VKTASHILIFVSLVALFNCSKSGHGGKPDTREIPIVITIPDLEVADGSASPQDKGSIIPEEARDVANDWQGFETVEDIEAIVEEKEATSYDLAPSDRECVPSCEGKECGPDGCGGSCGKCAGGQPCINGRCQCIPACSGKECGDDGCGGQCKPGCAPNVPCLDNGKCAKDGPCSRIGSIKCEDVGISGSTATQNSDVLDLYSCDDKVAEGPEKVYKFVADQDGNVTFTLTPLLPINAKDFLRLYVLEDIGGLCSSKNCISKDPSTVSMSVTQGKTYYVVVDAIQNNTATYDLEINCSWYVPPADY
jgi:hypothetical protein